MRIYEELFIIKPESTEEEIDQVIETMKGVVTAAEGTVTVGRSLRLESRASLRAS